MQSENWPILAHAVIVSLISSAGYNFRFGGPIGLKFCTHVIWGVNMGILIYAVSVENADTQPSQGHDAPCDSQIVQIC